MRIAQVAPLFESVPPQLYGGTERIVSYLTEELVRTGHDVVLFASGDSRTSARLIPMCERSLRLHDPSGEHLARHILMLEHVFARAHEFDLIHFHTDYVHFPLARRCPVATVTTLHGRQDIPGLAELYREYMEMPLVSISDSQRRPIPHAHWVGTVYHGLPEHLYRCGHGRGGYLVYTGRISPEKRPDLAIRIAREAGMELRMAAKIDKKDQDYFDAAVRPLLREPGIVWIGEIDDRQKGELLGGALAMLFPIRWPEPFGLVMIESLACGTPVIAFRHGSVPEVIDHGITGFIVDDVPEAVEAVRHAHRLDRGRIRRQFEQRFSARRMAADYARIYRERLRGAARPPAAPRWGHGGEPYGAVHGEHHRG